MHWGESETSEAPRTRLRSACDDSPIRPTLGCPTVGHASMRPVATAEPARLATPPRAMAAARAASTGASSFLLQQWPPAGMSGGRSCGRDRGGLSFLREGSWRMVVLAEGTRRAGRSCRRHGRRPSPHPTRLVRVVPGAVRSIRGGVAGAVPGTCRPPRGSHRVGALVRRCQARVRVPERVGGGEVR